MSDAAAALKQVVESSSTLTQWALAIAAGSVATIVGTSFRRPPTLAHRLPYLLFVPGWIFIGHAIFLANRISGMHIASLLVSPEVSGKIAAQINDAYAEQRISVLAALGFFGAWLLIYTLLWILADTWDRETTK